MSEEEIIALIKQRMTVQVCVTSGPDVEVTLLWDGEPFSWNSDSTGCDGDQGGPQA